MIQLVALAGLLSVSTAALAAPHERYRVFYRDRWIDYVEQDGLAIAEGDILLGSATDVARLRDASVVRKALVIDQTELLWPIGASGVHEVPYLFEAGSQANVEAAVAQLNSAFTGIVQWVPRATQSDYVAFDLTGSSGTCFSSVGRIGGRQRIGGSMTCTVGSLMHEMGHAMGFWHTQSNAAQGSFLRVRYENMDPLWRPQFTPIVDARAIDGYDYASIMHYSPFVESMTADPMTAITLPAGIDTGQRVVYSAVDADAVKRLYGGAPNAVTVTSNPSGLQVVVDGAVQTTPVTLNWRMGSLHRLDVPSGLQASGGFKFGFGRWSHDASATPLAAQEWIVDPGQGFMSQPLTAPRNTVLVANFVRLVQVQPVLSGAAFGQFSVAPETAPWPGTPDLYPQFTKFDFFAQPNTDYLNTWFTTSYITLTGGGGGVSSGSRRIGTVSPLQLGGSLFAGPAIVVQTTGIVDNGSLRANITAPGATSQPVSTLIPNVLRSAAAGSYAITADATQSRSDSVQFVLQSIEGLDNSGAGLIAMPGSGQSNKIVTINFQQQFQPVMQRNPTCGGALILSPTATWLPYGTALTATAVPAAGAIFAGWSGSLSGTSTVANMTVDRVPEITANFNVVPEPFAVTAVTPTTYAPGQGPVTFEFAGTGFSANTFLSLENGSRKFGQATDSHTFRVTLSDSDFSHQGKTAMDLGSTLGPGCVVYSGTIAVDVFPAVAPQRITVYEFYNPALNRYFRTASDAEAAAIRANPATGEHDTGQTFQAWASTAFPAGAGAVYRFYGSVSPGPNSHFYTADASEARTLQRAELDTPSNVKRWNYEELSFAIKPAQNGGCPDDAPVRIYRAYNNGFALGRDSNHRYLTDFGLYTEMIALGWQGEGVAMCGPH